MLIPADAVVFIASMMAFPLLGLSAGQFTAPEDSAIDGLFPYAWQKDVLNCVQKGVFSLLSKLF
jgi:hypothetical protein